MLDRQERTNAAYTGVSWRGSMDNNKLMAAIMDEAGEFLREVKPVWKWWDKNAVMDREKALFEAVDMFHFLLTFYLKTMAHEYNGVVTRFEKPETLTTTVESVNKILTTYSAINQCPLKTFNEALSNTLHYKVGFLHSILNMQVACCSILGYTPEEFYQAYILKNDRNLERVAKGVMDGVDVKATEQELHLA